MLQALNGLPPNDPPSNPPTTQSKRDRSMKYPAKSGQPTASKDRGAEWYWPAVTVEFGRPKRLPHGGRHETRGKAKSEATRMIAEATAPTHPKADE